MDVGEGALAALPGSQRLTDGHSFEDAVNGQSRDDDEAPDLRQQPSLLGLVRQGRLLPCGWGGLVLGHRVSIVAVVVAVIGMAGRMIICLNWPFISLIWYTQINVPETIIAIFTHGKNNDAFS